MSMAVVVACSSRESESLTQMTERAQAATSSVTALLEHSNIPNGASAEDDPYAFCAKIMQDYALASNTESWLCVNGQTLGVFESTSLKGACREALDAFSTNSATSFSKEVETPTGRQFFYAIPIQYSLSDGLSFGEGFGNGAICIAFPTKPYDDRFMFNVCYDIGFSLLLALICVICMWLPLRRLVTAPIERLTEETSFVTKETLSTGIDVAEIRPYGEIASLVANFNQMLDRLNTSYSDIEAKVDERTHELRNALEELSSHQKEIEALNDRLSQENEYKSNFLAVMSHELKTPLAAMGANIEYLKARAAANDVRSDDEAFDDIEHNASDLLKLINQILDASRLEAGKMSVTEEPVDMVDVMGAVDANCVPIAKSRGITYESSLSEDVPLLFSDSDKLLKICSALTSNALKFTPKGGHVSFDILREGTQLRIDVTDDGIGLNGADPNRLFERFYQVNQTLSRRYGGTGLGLSLAKEFTELLGGSIGAHDSGNQTHFWVLIPLKEYKGED